MGLFSSIEYSQVFFDLMFVTMGAGLVLYAAGDTNLITVEEVNKKLYDTKQLVNDLVMQSPEGICIFDIGGNVLLLNNSFIKIFNIVENDKIKGLNIFKHFETFDNELKLNLMRVKEGETVIFSCINLADIYKNFSNIYLSVKFFPIYSSNKKISGFILILEDITKQKLDEEELIEAKTQAELYIDLMGHDINNMNQIGIGYLEMALDRLSIKDDDRILLKKPLEIMENSSRLIDNVRKIRRIKTNGLEIEPVDISKAIDDVVKEHSGIHGRDIIIDYKPGKNMYVLANSLIKDIFINLVDNSIKHSSGDLTINIIVKDLVVNGQKFYEILVEDNGPGISNEMKAMVFDRIYRSMTKSGCHGIGLYLVKLLVNKFNGKIIVEDRVAGDRSKGSRFIVTLPAYETAGSFKNKEKAVT
jgi:PAS domain S-box-containing protein